MSLLPMKDHPLGTEQVLLHSPAAEFADRLQMMLRAKYCDAHGTLKPEYPTFWQFRYFFRKNRDPISETISRQGLKAYQRNHRPFTGSVCDYAHTIGVYMTDATVADIYIVSRLSRNLLADLSFIRWSMPTAA